MNEHLESDSSWLSLVDDPITKCSPATPVDKYLTRLNFEGLVDTLPVARDNNGSDVCYFNEAAWNSVDRIVETSVRGRDTTNRRVRTNKLLNCYMKTRRASPAILETMHRYKKTTYVYDWEDLTVVQKKGTFIHATVASNVMFRDEIDWFNPRSRYDNL